MKKLFSIISKKDFLFGICLFTAVILITLLQPSNRVSVEFGETAVDVLSARYTMNIPYDQIVSLEVVDVPPAGDAIDGKDNITNRYGVWENDTWGEHYLCLDLVADNCIVARLQDGKIFVFSHGGTEETIEVYEELQTYLQDA